MTIEEAVKVLNDNTHAESNTWESGPSMIVSGGRLMFMSHAEAFTAAKAYEYDKWRLAAIASTIMEMRWREAALEAARLLAGPVVEDEATHPADCFWTMLEALGVDTQNLPPRS